MPTIIDSLVVEFGLDPQGKFLKTASEIEEGLKKTKEAAKGSADLIERSMKDVGESLRKVRDDLIGLFVAFTAGRGIKEFVQDITATDAGLGRLSKQLGISVETIAAWGGASKRFGGSVEATAGTMKGLTDQFEQFQLTGQSSIVPYLYALQVGFSRTADGALDLNKLLLDLADAGERIHDNARTTTILRSMGIDEGTLNVILQGRVAVQALLEEQKKLGTTTKQSADSAQVLVVALSNLEQSATTIGRNLLVTLGPALVGILQGMQAISDWAQQYMPVVEAAFVALTGVVIALSAAITVSLVGSALSSAFAAFAALGAILGGVTVGPLIAGIAAVSVVIYELWKHWTELNKAISTFFGTSLTVARPTTNGPAPKKAASSAAPKKGATNNANKSDVEKFVDMGWTKAQAQGIVANLQRESGGKADASGDSGLAYGIAQWHPDRQAAFAKWTGHDIRKSTKDEQLAFVNYELRRHPEYGGKQLASAKDASSAAEIVSRLFERPAAADQEASIRANLAAGLAGGSTSYNSTTQNTISIGNITVETKATDADGIAKDLGPAIKRSTFSQNSNYGPN